MKITRFSTRSIIAIQLVGGCLALAVWDGGFRLSFFDLAKVGIGGYFGQMLPESKEDLSKQKEE